MLRKAKIQYGTISIPYLIIKSKRVKTSEIIVDADKVTIRTPLNKDLSEIHGIVSDKASWILKKQKEYKETTPQIVKPSFKEGSTLPYFGRNCLLKILKQQGKCSIEFVDGEFIVKTNTFSKESSSATEIKQLYDDWLMNNAHRCSHTR
jgi:predicted metal-dependent hydrolase